MVGLSFLIMTTATASKIETHPPLARDASGNLLPIPDGTCSWRICRETAGRPREVRGPDRNAVRFPLQTSSDDLVELCGAGVYRVYALGQLGELLAEEHVAKWDLSTPVRELRNASVDPMIALRSERSTPASATNPTSDLRFALETMAQMMRTNSDALRLVAESQVDLAKTIATVKGLPRNAAMYLPPVPANDTEEEDEEKNDEEAAASPTNYLDLLMPFSEALAGKVADMVPTGMFSGAASVPHAEETTPTRTSSPTPGGSDDLATRPFEARELVDFDYAYRKGQAKRVSASRQPTAAGVPLQTRAVKDPQLLRQILAIKSALAPEDVQLLLSMASAWSESEQSKFLDMLKPLPAEEAIAFCRELIADVRAQHAAHAQPATKEVV